MPEAPGCMQSAPSALSTHHPQHPAAHREPSCICRATSCRAHPPCAGWLLSSPALCPPLGQVSQAAAAGRRQSRTASLPLQGRRSTEGVCVWGVGGWGWGGGGWGGVGVEGDLDRGRASRELAAFMYAVQCWLPKAAWPRHCQHSQSRVSWPFMLKASCCTGSSSAGQQQRQGGRARGDLRQLEACAVGRVAGSPRS